MKRKYRNEAERLADLDRLAKTDWDNPQEVAALFLECAQTDQEQEEPESPAGNLVEPPAAVQ